MVGGRRLVTVEVALTLDMSEAAPALSQEETDDLAERLCEALCEVHPVANAEVTSWWTEDKET